MDYIIESRYYMHFALSLPLLSLSGSLMCEDGINDLYQICKLFLIRKMVEIAEADNNELFSIFDELKLNLTTYKHPECVNVEVQAEHLSGLQGSLTKNLFTRKRIGYFIK